MKTKYGIEQRLAFIARNKCTINGVRVRGKWQHFVGYVKQIRHSLFGVRYVINVACSKDVYIVPPRDIIGIVEKREHNTNQINKSNEYGKI